MAFAAHFLAASALATNHAHNLLSLVLLSRVLSAVEVLFTDPVVRGEVSLTSVSLFPIALARLSPSEGRSTGVSSRVSASSECSPTGFSGRRSVPLLGLGLIERESQIIL